MFLQICLPIGRHSTAEFTVYLEHCLNYFLSSFLLDILVKLYILPILIFTSLMWTLQVFVF